LKKKKRHVKNRVPSQDNNALVGGYRKVTKRKKRQILIILILILCAILYGVVLYKHHAQQQRIIEQQNQLGKTTGENAAKQKTDANGNLVTKKHVLTIRIINVGEGEAVYVSSGKKNVLIDGGGGGKYTAALQKAIAPAGGVLDYVINTSPTAYRLKGLAQVYRTTKVDHTLYCQKNAEAGKDTEAMDAFLNAAKQNGSKLSETGAGTINLGNGMTIRMIPLPDAQSPSRVLACYIRYNDFGFLMTSDAQGGAERKLLTALNGGNTNSDGQPVSCWLLGTLGAGNVAQQALINKFDPDFYFLSCSSPRVNGGVSPGKDLIAKFDDNLYATYQYGDIVVKYDGGQTVTNLDGKTALSLENFTAKSFAVHKEED
jgi:beta-lactamase superfamily II metal-dependent hydrolase